MSRDIAVVIAFFQREAGVLGRTLRSVAAQQGVDFARIEVVVVDDCSPVSVASELAGEDFPFELRTIRQPRNGGPGAARNAGLDALGPEVAFVAFLDSDDVWLPDHLAVALRALEAGGTFFFANLFQLGSDTPAFERAGRIDPAAHAALGNHCHRYAGDMLEQIYTGNVIGTSTVLYRLARHAALRFDPVYRRAGEDYIMWSCFAADGAQFVFRATPSVRYLDGVNIYSGVVWGSPQFLQRTGDEIAYLRHALRQFALKPATRAAMRQRIGGLRRDWWRSALKLLVTRPAALVGEK